MKKGSANVVVYLVRATEWDTDVNCVCATREIAERERKRLAKFYDLSDDEIEDCIECTEMKVISE